MRKILTADQIDALLESDISGALRVAVLELKEWHKNYKEVTALVEENKGDILAKDPFYAGIRTALYRMRPADLVDSDNI